MNSSKIHDGLKKYEGRRIKGSGDEQYFIFKGHPHYLSLEAASVCEEMIGPKIDNLTNDEEWLLSNASTAHPLNAQQMRKILEPRKEPSTTGKRHKVFVASSKEAKAQAELLIKELKHPSVRFVPWWVPPRPGHFFLSELKTQTNQCDAALFLFTPDIKGRFRRKSVRIPNQNVLFELGCFWRALGPKKIALIRYGKTYVSSDLDGWIVIPENNPFQFSKPTPPSAKTRADFKSWVATLKSKHSPKTKS